MVDGFSRLTDGPGEYFVFIKTAPLAALVQLDEMGQHPARPEKLHFGLRAFYIG
jgi:hypothetical protein